MGSPSGTKSSITHTAGLRDVILDVKVMYVEAVQNHNPPVDHGAFGKLWVIVLVSLAVQRSVGLKDWNLSLKPFIFSCQEVGAF